MTYEELLGDKPATIGRISDFLGLGKTAEECAAAVHAVDADKVRTRFNMGVAGRGKQTLDDEQIARLRRLVAAYGFGMVIFNRTRCFVADKGYKLSFLDRGEGFKSSQSLG